MVAVLHDFVALLLLKCSLRLGGEVGSEVPAGKSIRLRHNLALSIRLYAIVAFPSRSQNRADRHLRY